MYGGLRALAALGPVRLDRKRKSFAETLTRLPTHAGSLTRLHVALGESLEQLESIGRLAALSL